MSTIIVATGGFDPIHSGHIEYLKAAKQLGDVLVVGVNSDDWLIRKKGQYFMDQKERMAVVDALGCVDRAIKFSDDDDTACGAIEFALHTYPNDKFIFVNGGDRTATNIPEEVRYLNNDRVSFVFGVGGDMKRNSSSWLLQEWKAPRTVRNWGYYRVLHEDVGVKVKEITVEPHMSLSMQKHHKRSEFWLVSDGECIVEYEHGKNHLDKHNTTYISVGSWHKLTNPFDTPCKIIEIQYGVSCIEEDIERQ